MYEFVVDETKGIATLGGHPLKQLAKFQIKANGPDRTSGSNPPRYGRSGQGGCRSALTMGRAVLRTQECL